MNFLIFLTTSLVLNIFSYYIFIHIPVQLYWHNIRLSKISLPTKIAFLLGEDEKFLSQLYFLLYLIASLETSLEHYVSKNEHALHPVFNVAETSWLNTFRLYFIGHTKWYNNKLLLWLFFICSLMSTNLLIFTLHPTQASGNYLD